MPATYTVALPMVAGVVRIVVTDAVSGSASTCWATVGLRPSCCSGAMTAPDS
jgi:hypothetical protein